MIILVGLIVLAVVFIVGAKVMEWLGIEERYDARRRNGR